MIYLSNYLTKKLEKNLWQQTLPLDYKSSKASIFRRIQIIMLHLTKEHLSFNQLQSHSFNHY
ncbi:CLUMA_CG006452, isoform A [Clunio marinus]|uniref:CLUMA_CG006452, isoform A n=1 Tax=Clunio marinus TaxID=568069 RepID=A0A1J1HXI4_9DIPT|nr:CLUMA_CG006452, isoform A [Clunio marinus]